MSVVQPAPAFNFMVTFMDVEGPEQSALGAAASAALSVGASILFGGFSEVTGLNAETEVESYQEGGRNRAPHRFVKSARFPNIVLKRGVTPNPDLWDWHHQVVSFGARQIRKSGLIILLDRGGPNVTQGKLGFSIPGLDRMPLAAWSFSRAIPERLTGPSLNAKTNELAIESLELSHEGLTRVSPATLPGASELSGALLALVSGIAAGGASILAAAGTAGTRR